MPSALVFAAPRFSQDEIDRVLIQGTNEHVSRFHILTEYQKDKTISEIAAMLPRAFVGGKGFETDQGKVCAWYGEDGIHLTRGTASRHVVSAQIIPWEAAAERIAELLEQGQYATYEELAVAPAFERKELADQLWYMRQDLDEKGAEYLTTIGEHYSGASFDDATAKIVSLLEQPESRKALTAEVGAFVQAYQQDHSLLRFHFHDPLDIQRRMEELELPRQDYESVIPEIPQESGFITQDEIDGTLAERNVYSDGNLRIYAYFQDKHTQTEKIAFIKDYYGTGGCSHALFGASGSWLDYSAKGMSFRKEGCENVSLTWAAVAKRIDDLIAHGRYLTEDALERINATQEEPAPSVTEVPKPAAIEDEMSEFFAIDTEKARKALEERGIVNGELVDPDKLEQDPFIQQVEADVARIAAEQDASPYERFSVIETEDGYAIWDNQYEGYYVDKDGVVADFKSEWQAEDYLKEVRKAVEAQNAADWLYVEQAKVERTEPQPIEPQETAAPVAAEADVPVVSPNDQPLPYSVGDTLYLEDGKAFIIEAIGDSDIRLRDPSLTYPIARVESKERLARLLERYPQPPHTTPAAQADVLPSAKPKIIAYYPAEENNLPFNIVIESLGAGESAHEQPEKVDITPRAENFHITDDHLGEGGAKTKYQWNVEAIRTLQAIEAEGRSATPDEQEILSRYVGWGGIPQAFDERNDSWAKEYGELKALLPEAEYASARASTLNAHYTSPTVIRAIYGAVERMGFSTGNILEPACGVGNFFGLLPESMAGSNLYGVELDSITGRIAQQLYPQANIAAQGFEKTDRRDFYDLAIGNVPFGSYSVSDKAYDKLHFHIHDYFFAKALDQVRPSGVVAFITSKGTMDKQSPDVRKYIAQRAELLGAVRLPNNAFKANAGTEVTSDILFLQKRDRPIDIEPDWVHLSTTEDGIPINSYFADHPEMVLGQMAWDDSMYGNRQETACLPIEGAVLADQLTEAMQHITGQITEAELPDLGEGESIDTSIPADPRVRNFSYTIVNGDVYYRENSRMVKPELNATAVERVKGLVGLRDCVSELIEQQMDNAPDEIVQRTQARLNVMYDGFTAKLSGQIPRFPRLWKSRCAAE